MFKNLLVDKVMKIVHFVLDCCYHGAEAYGRRDDVRAEVPPGTALSSTLQQIGNLLSPPKKPLLQNWQFVATCVKERESAGRTRGARRRARRRSPRPPRRGGRAGAPRPAAGLARRSPLVRVLCQIVKTS